jgi:aminopeptidase N
VSSTLAEARARAGTLTDVSYGVALDLADLSDDTFGCRTTVRFRCTSDETFLELTAARSLGDPGRRAGWTPSSTVAGCCWVVGAEVVTRHKVVVDARLPFVTDGSGMLRMVDPVTGDLRGGVHRHRSRPTSLLLLRPERPQGTHRAERGGRPGLDGPGERSTRRGG